MRVTYHPSVQADIDGALSFYGDISPDLADAFWDKLFASIDHARRYPGRYRVADCGLRRVNLERFPYHFLYEDFPDRLRIIVVRHHKRSPSFGTGRR